MVFLFIAIIEFFIPMAIFAFVVLLVIFINWFVSIGQLRGNDNNHFKRVDRIFQIPLMC